MNDNRWVVRLTPGECIIAATIAANRQFANREANVHNLQGGPQAKMTTELVGVFGELAVARMLNCYPDLSTHIRSGGGDLQVGLLTVDVKTTRNPRGDLWVDARSDKLSDVYVLAVADWTTVTAVGYATLEADCRNEFANADKSGWTIPQRALRPMRTLGHLMDSSRRVP